MTDVEPGDDVEPLRKALTPKQKLRSLSPKFGPALLKLSKRRRNGAAQAEAPEAQKLAHQIAELLANCLIVAAEDLDFDLDDSQERFWLLCMLAWSVYGGKSRGRAKKWTEEKHAQLLSDVHEVQKNRPNLTELQACEVLFKGKWKNDTHLKNKRTLLRQLQVAKAKMELLGRTAKSG